MQETNPWLKVRLKPYMMTSVTLLNRLDCCAERLRNVQVRAGLTDSLTNNIVGTFKGPGTLSGRHIIQFASSVLVEYMTFQIIGEQEVLHINGIRLNEVDAMGMLRVFTYLL